MIDDIDRSILALLQANARIPNAEIARHVGLAASAVHDRIRKLEERDVLRGYFAVVNPEAVDLGLTAFIFVRSDEPVSRHESADRLATLPEVQEVHHVAGEDCYLLKVRVRDTRHLGRLLRRKIGLIESVRSTRTTIVLEVVKEEPRINVVPEVLDPENEAEEERKLP